ncbi:MAG: translesion error-prone DNA polymerase V autoproteolytic subunit [Mycolicibacterium sp.]|uniref:Peptidase S24 n=1 Tax=Mycobacterium avium TaxID=1764 RepID=A0A2A2ZAX3_MYCAV|nr:peptidase S24 [Mycobacterium avium]RUP32647.1 MAG: translesion error-prone DNA polymerase V autoproteolytic subunit [Mycolicibacterium sp.]
MFYPRGVVELSPVHAVPLWISEAVSTVAAGWPSPADDYLEGPIDLSERLMPRPAATFLVRASGWSMKGAGISDGDMLIVERGRTAVDGQIVIAVVDGEFLVKTLRSSGRRPRLVAAHPDFPDIPLLGREVVIWGVVCWVLHKTI